MENAVKHGNPCRWALEYSNLPHQFLFCGWEEVTMTAETLSLIHISEPTRPY